MELFKFCLSHCSEKCNLAATTRNAVARKARKIIQRSFSEQKFIKRRRALLCAAKWCVTSSGNYFARRDEMWNVYAHDADLLGCTSIRPRQNVSQINFSDSYLSEHSLSFLYFLEFTLGWTLFDLCVCYSYSELKRHRYSCRKTGYLQFSIFIIPRFFNMFLAFSTVFSTF
jgi:hypothetical protein